MGGWDIAFDIAFIVMMAIVSIGAVILFLDLKFDVDVLASVENWWRSRAEQRLHEQEQQVLERALMLNQLLHDSSFEARQQILRAAAETSKNDANGHWS